MNPMSAPSRLLLLALAIVALLAALWAGWVRLGWLWPVPEAGFTLIHGPLMVCAFLGTLIALERAVALQQRWMYVGPLLTGLAGVSLIVGLAPSIGAILITLGSLGFIGIMIVIIRRQFALYTIIMFAGVLSWLIGNLLWLFGLPIYRMVLWWIAFLVLTVAGERLELGRLVRLSRTEEGLFIAGTSVLLLGNIVALSAFDLGTRISSLGLLALALWLLRFDVARHTIRQKGLPRFAASCLMAGYVWLGTSGTLGLLIGGQAGGFKYDALLHTVFVGFVISMIFGHAPIIFPAILRLPIRYTPIFYVHLVLLHLSLMIRISGDLLASLPLRMWGGLLNGVAILVFLMLTVYSIASSKKGTAIAPTPSN
jgi:hypothetical protein